MIRVFVCAGMNLARDENINRQARELGEFLGKNQFVTYVQGGSEQGLMGETLKEFLKYSKNVEFFIPDVYYDYDAPGLINLVGEENFRAYRTQGEAERLMAITSCDSIIVLPGGTGTLEELLYCNETLRAGEHLAKVTVVNVNGFFNGFLQQLETNTKQGLSKQSAIKFDVVDSVKDLSIGNINENFPEK